MMRLMVRAKRKMKIRQGKTRVMIESDGSLIIYPKSGHDCNYPVVVIEVTCFLTLYNDISLNG